MKFKRSLVKIIASAVVFVSAAATLAPATQADAVTPETNVSAPAQTKVKKVSNKQKKLNAIVKLAKKKVGKPYVWGATGPNAFDCSGLSSYVYAHAAKKNITRTTYTQVKKGKRVSLKHLKKGDLLFWGSKSAPYHVGIYIGGGKYIHAATPSQGVRKQTLSHYFYPSQARRIL